MVPAHPLTRAATSLLVSTLLLIGCSGDDPGDVASFCEAVDALADGDPFETLDVASPGEMRTAFEELRAGVAAIERGAPDDLDSRADRYLETVDALLDDLRGAGFDPRNLDTLSYRAAASDYQAAAVSIENAAHDACP